MTIAATQEGRGRPVFGRRDPDARGYFGEFGGRFVPETLVAPMEALTDAYFEVRTDASFIAEFEGLLRQFVGRPTPLYEAARLTEACGGATILLKREDLAHTGAHKINNALGQALPASTAWRRRPCARSSACSASSTWASTTWRARPSTSSGCGCWAPTCAASTPDRGR